MQRYLIISHNLISPYPFEQRVSIEIRRALQIAGNQFELNPLYQSFKRAVRILKTRDTSFVANFGDTYDKEIPTVRLNKYFSTIYLRVFLKHRVPKPLS